MHINLQVLWMMAICQGRTVSFKDTIAIMTSNAGTGKALRPLVLEREGRTNSCIENPGNFSLAALNSWIWWHHWIPTLIKRKPSPNRYPHAGWSQSTPCQTGSPGCMRRSPMIQGLCTRGPAHSIIQDHIEDVITVIITWEHPENNSKQLWPKSNGDIASKLFWQDGWKEVIIITAKYYAQRVGQKSVIR